jgi:hypothetical protein
MFIAVINFFFALQVHIPQGFETSRPVPAILTPKD